MIDLKPCPFCGGDDLELAQEDMGPDGWTFVIECHDCFARGPDGWRRKEAEEAWNTRHED